MAFYTKEERKKARGMNFASFTSSKHTEERTLVGRLRIKARTTFDVVEEVRNVRGQTVTVKRFVPKRDGDDGSGSES